MSRLAVTALLALLASSPARAADEDAHVWASAVASGHLEGKLLVWLEGQARIGDDTNRFRQFMLRPAIGVDLGKGSSAYLGYALVRTGTPDNLASEHRVWQQLGYTIVARDAVKVTGRSRFEQRFFVGRDGVALRFRQQVRVVAPVAKGLSAVVWSEPFVNLNAPFRPLRTGIDRWRNQVGVNVPLSKTVALEPGYMNQYIRRAGPDLVDHIALMNVAIKW
jgi:hypothetical protein